MHEHRDAGSAEEGDRNGKDENEDQALACEFDAIDPNERREHESTAQLVFASVSDIRETSDGYAFRLPADPDSLAAAGRFIARERLCCPFFTFELSFEANRGPVWLQLSGESPVKEYIRDNVLPVVREAQRLEEAEL